MSKSWSSFLDKFPIVFEMDKCWFFILNENISGPFSTEEIKIKISQAGPEAQCLVWTKGQKQWIPAATWEKDHQQILKLSPKGPKDAAIWYVGYQENTHGPISHHELIKFLEGIDSFEWDAVRVWSAGQDTWSKIFQYSEIIEELGGSRRIHVRAPLKGTVTVNKDGVDQIGRAMTLSLGGIGVSGLRELRSGEVIKLTIKSEDLGLPIYCSAQVRYLTPEEVGLQFQNLHMEFQARILDYVKRFQNSGTTKAAA